MMGFTLLAILWFSGSTTSEHHIHHRTILVTDHGIRPDGQTDNSPILQRLLEGDIEPGTVFVFPPGTGSYQFGSTVQLRELQHVTIKGEEGGVRPVLEFTHGRSVGLRLIGSSDIRISNMHLKGAGVRVPGVNAAPLKVIYSRRIFLEDLVVEDGVTNGIEGLLSDSCVIEDNVIFGTKNHNGIGWAGGRGNVFRRNRCYRNAGQGMELRSQADALVAENACFENGSSEEQSSGITIECEDGSVPVEPDSIDGRMIWRVSGPSGYAEGMKIAFRHPRAPTNIDVRVSVERDPVKGGLILSIGNPSDGLMSPGRVPFFGTDPELMDHGAHRIRVQRNRVENNRGFGIYVVSSRRDHLSDVSIEGNNVLRNDRAGIHIATAPDAQGLRQTRNVRVRSNVIQRNGWKRGEPAIWLYFADSVSIEANRIIGNAQGDSIWTGASTNVQIAN